MVNIGRPTLNNLINKVDAELEVFHKETKWFPAGMEFNEVWKDIWLEETHHSTALEGNTLNSHEVFCLVEDGLVTGHKEMRHYLEVQGYSMAARWVYDTAVEAYNRREQEITLNHISHIHKLLMEAVWASYPPVTGDRPGQIRAGLTLKIRGTSLKLPPSGDVPDLLANLVKDMNAGPGDQHVISWSAKIHAQFEAIHPFRDGNGRTGRLLMNYLLILKGYPPAIILKSQRPKYLRALARAQQKTPDYTMLTELIARSIHANLNKLLLPYISKDNDLIPLSAVAEDTPYEPSYLRRLAQEGKLKAIKEGSLWLSSKQWLKEYINSRSPRGRKSKGEQI